MTSVQDYGDLLRILLEYRSWPPDSEAAYDVIGIGQLMVACLENLRIHHVEADVPALATLLSDQQRSFLVKLASAAPYVD